MAYVDPILLAQRQYGAQRAVQDFRAKEAAAPQAIPQPVAAPSRPAVRLSASFRPQANSFTVEPSAPMAPQPAGDQAAKMQAETTALQAQQPMAPTQELISKSRASAVSNLASQGITDVKTALDFLNKDEQGNVIGDFTEQEVASLLARSPQQQVQTTAEKFGVAGSTAQSPFTAMAENYRQVYASLGLPDVSEQIKQATQSFTDVQNELTDRISDVNENPWLTEPQRQERVSALQRRYEMKLANAQSKVTILNNLLQAGSEEARFIAQQAFAEQRAGTQFQQELALKAIDMGRQQAEAERRLAQDRKEFGLKERELAIKEAEAARKPERQYASGIIGEYQFYAEQEAAAGRTPVSFNDYQTIDANRKARVARAGVSGGDSPLVSAIIANPELFNQLTPTDKAKVIPALNAAGFTAFGKPLSDTAIKEITQSETAIEQLEDLKGKIQSNLQYVGPIKGLAAVNPYSKARQVQADINRVKQNVGKALEGGVLRKEDEEKYKKILATLTDTPETAAYKLNQLITQVKSDVSRYKSNQALGGRNVGQSDTSGDPLGIK